MKNLLIFMLFTLFFYYFFFNKNIEKMSNNDYNPLNYVFDISNNKFFSKKKYSPNHILLRCKYDKSNICDNLTISDTLYNTKILFNKDDNYPLISNIGIKKGDEIIVQPYDFNITSSSL
jgi:hypothetical protein